MRQKFWLTALVIAVIACGTAEQTGGSAKPPQAGDEQKEKKPSDELKSSKKDPKTGNPIATNTAPEPDNNGINTAPQTSPGMPQPATSSSGSTSTAPLQNSTTVTPPTDPNVVVFRIKAGTDRGPWNDAANPIRIRVGQTLEIFNDDSIQHWIHTNFGQFMNHPFSGINPGQSARYQIGNTNANGLRDHNTGGAIYMEISP